MKLLQSHVTSEKEEKRDSVIKLKKQLEVHQEHVNKLKSDLTAAYRQQVRQRFCSSDVLAMCRWRSHRSSCCI